MTQYLPIILAAAALAFLSTPLTRWLAHRVGMVDQPGLRKAHRAPTPLLGGLAMYLGIILAFLTLGERDWVSDGIGILGGATLLFFTGLWDDRFGLSPRLKLAACAVAGLFLSAFGVRVLLFDNWWLDTLITLLWVVGVTNAANLMDNMDGLAAGLTAVAAVFFFILAALEGQGLVASLAAALLGAAVGFLFYNMAPAVSFMGDAGSLTLGFLLAALGIKIRFLALPLGATWMAPIVVLGLFIFDTTLVTVSRLRRGRSPFQGGSDHTSHRLTQLGLSKPRAVLTLYVAAVSLGATAILLTRLPVLTANLFFAALVGAGLVALMVFERIEPKLTGDPPLVVVTDTAGQAVTTAGAISRALTVVVTPTEAAGGVQPDRAAMVELVAALAEDPPAVRAVLTAGLAEAWWDALPLMARALRLHGAVLAVGGPAGEAQWAEAAAALRKARAIIVQSAAPLPAVLSRALAEAEAPRLWVGAAPAEDPRAVSTTAAALGADLQRLLLQQAARQTKTSVPVS